MLYCAYTCDYVFFSGFSQASRNFLANFREGARKSLNRAENRGGLGIIRDDSGSIRKVLKTVCLHGRVSSNLTPSAKLLNELQIMRFVFCSCKKQNSGSTQIIILIGVLLTKNEKYVTIKEIIWQWR